MSKSEYLRGYTDAQKKYENAIHNDIANLYNIGGVVLKDEFKFTDEMIEEWINKTADLWQEVVNSGEKVKDFVARKLGFEVIQENSK